jgi:hypothetical protein
MARFDFHATDGRELVRDAKGDEIAHQAEPISPKSARDKRC